MKVYIKFDESSKEMEIKLKLPKKWVSGTLKPLKETFIESFNKKHPEHVLTIDGTHFLNRKGESLADEEIVEKVFEEGEHIRLVAGKPPVYVAPVVEEVKVVEGGVRCKNYGCQTVYLEDDNHDTACSHHCGPPIFHDTRKGWSCCKDKMAYDWDEFQAIPPCSKGRHSTVDPKISFAASPTVAVASNAAAGNGTPTPAPVAIKSIESFNASNPDAITSASSAAKTIASVPKVEKRTDGLAKCINKGCQKLYKVDENDTSSCTFHPGKPVFHDAKKYWSCCEEKRRVAYDFDEFLQIEGCHVGPHCDGGSLE